MEKSCIIKVTEGPWKGWMRKDCGIQFGAQVYFYYPEYITGILNE